MPGVPIILIIFFRILSGAYKRNEEGAYREYQSALRRFNNELKSLSRKIKATFARHVVYASSFLGYDC